MKTLLVLAQHPELAETLRTALDAGEFRVVHRTSWEEAEPLLIHGLAQICLLDADLTGVQTIWLVEKIRRALPRLPILVCSSASPWELEEEAYLKGVSHVLHKPIRGRMFNAVLSRVLGGNGAAPVALPVSKPAFDTTHVVESPVRGGGAASPTLEVLRDYSSILTHSLNAESMLKQFLLFLRETLGVNRAAIFLRRSETAFGSTPFSAEGRRLHSACAIGLASGLLEHFELSFDAGIGGQVFKLGRIVRRNSEEALSDSEAQKEFELLGAQVAVPILDRETVVGVALFDGRVTGEQLVNHELELIFHLLEHVGLGIRNIWLHDQLTANNEMMADVLRELSSACVVISRDLGIIHANKAARKLFGRTGARAGDLEFTDIPQLLGGKVYQVLKTGAAIEQFRYQPEDAVRTAVYRVTIAPFHRQGTANAALLVVEDLTQTEQLQKLEVEASSLRLVKVMADRLAHEVGNALVPLSTHQQLLTDKYRDPEFRASLDVALAEGVKRIARLTNQMRFLARDSIVSAEAFLLGPLIEEAYQEAQKYQPVKSARLKFEDTGKPAIVTGDRAALKHALAEVLLNALQSNPADPQIGVRLQMSAPGENGKGGARSASEESGLSIEIQDNGAGFTAEAVQKIPSPFYTTRNVGLGLGLTVTRKIIETHHGRLEIVPSKGGHNGLVRISLPMASTPAAAPRATAPPAKQVN